MDAGIYNDLSHAEYLAQTDWVSASMLKGFLPDHFKAPKTQGTLDFGSALHTKLLGVGEPVRPVTAASWQGKAAQMERDTAYASGQVPLLEKDIPTLDAMCEAALNHSQAGPLLRKVGQSELSVFTDVDGVPCRARFDRITDDGEAVDVKTTTNKPGPNSLVRSVVDYGYDLAADHYLRVASAAGLQADTFTLVFISSDPPHFVTVADLDSTFYDRAAVLRELALERWQHPDMVPAYPGADSRLTLSAPRWAQLG